MTRYRIAQAVNYIGAALIGVQLNALTFERGLTLGLTFAAVYVSGAYMIYLGERAR
jgi:hypothetical protein